MGFGGLKRFLEPTVSTNKKTGLHPAFLLSMEDEKTIWQKSLSQKEFLTLEYPAAQKATLRVSNPLPKLYTRLLNRQVRKEFLESRIFTAPNWTLGVRISNVYSIHLMVPTTSPNK